MKPLLKETLKPLIEEHVKIRLNELLAEKFVQSLGTRSIVSEVRDVQESAPKKDKTQLVESLKKKLGVQNNDPMSFVYDDVLDNQMAAQEDEGVDLSKLGWG